MQKSIAPHQEAIVANFSEVSKDIQGPNAHRYSRNITGGNQEFMEAASFSHYLATGRLLTYDDARAEYRRLCPATDAHQPGPELGAEDYILGLYDMTGELMRFAITAMATSGELPKVNGVDGQGRTVLSDLRTLRAGLEGLRFGDSGSLVRDVAQKAHVMRVSVEKVERALYGLVVRGAERPKGWMPDLEGSGGGEVNVAG